MTAPVELAPGLWRWTTPHPDWEPHPEPESPADWPRTVGSVAYAGPGALALIDPLVEGEAAWRALDRLVGERGLPVAVLTTLPFHARSADAVRERYGGAAAVPSGVEAVALPEAGETMYFIAEHGALVPGDRLLGDGRGGLRLCPESWLRYLDGDVTVDALAGWLRERVAPLPVERVLVSHGEPVVAGGGQALRRLLAA